jgi:predicted nucleic acid-binding Zn finger protein
MEAVREITGGLFPAHIYLLDGNNLVSYIKKGETEAFYFKKPIKGFDKRGRKFESVTPNPFKQKKESNAITIKGSKGQTYILDRESSTCTCPGFTFRGQCKHLAANG